MNGILLPEVFYYIFDYLTLAERKNVSTVCKLWNEIAFSPKYLQNVQFKIDSLMPDCMDLLIEITENSKRGYVFLELEGLVFDDERKKKLNIIKEFIYKNSDSLKSLKLNHNYSLTKKFVYQMLHQAPNLEQLTIFGRFDDDEDYIYCTESGDYHEDSEHEKVPIPQLENLKTIKLDHKMFDDEIMTLAPYLENMSLQIIYEKLEDFLFVLQCMSNLKCLELDMYNNDDFEGFELQTLFATTFDNLEKLTLKFNHRLFSCFNLVEFKGFLINHSSTLKALTLNYITGPICRIVLENCSFLKELHIELLRNESFDTITNIVVFENLTKLTLEENVNQLKPAFDRLHFPNVENLELMYTTLNPEVTKAIIKNMPKLKRLSVQDKRFNDECLGEICKRYRNSKLETIILLDPDVTESGLVGLTVIENLKYLTLDLTNLKRVTDFKCFPKFRLKRLELDNFIKIKDSAILEDSSKFENIGELLLFNFLMVTEDGIKELKKMLPNTCIQNHVEDDY